MRTATEGETRGPDHKDVKDVKDNKDNKDNRRLLFLVVPPTHLP